MPYCQYSESLEIELRKNSSRLAEIEKIEENKFNEILSKDENRLIDLLDLFFPPRFYNKKGQFLYYPSLPASMRQRMIELLREAVLDGRLLIKSDIKDLKQAFDELLQVKQIKVPSNFGWIKLWSHAYIDYDADCKPIVPSSSVLSSTIETKQFVELLLDQKFLPLELLHFDIVYDFFIAWNKKQLENVINNWPREEGRLLVDVVSVLAGFYMDKHWVANQNFIVGFKSSLQLRLQPLRWKQDRDGNMPEIPGLERQRGYIDSGDLPLRIVKSGELWDKILEEVQTAMSLGRIIHTNKDRGRVDLVNTRLDDKTLELWTKGKDYQQLTHSQAQKVRAKAKVRTRAVGIIEKIKVVYERLPDKSPKSVWEELERLAEADVPDAVLIDVSPWTASNAKIIWRCQNGKETCTGKKRFQNILSEISKSIK